MKMLKPGAAVLAALAIGALAGASSSKTVLERATSAPRIAPAEAWSLLPSDFNPFDDAAPIKYALRQHQPRE